MSNRYTKAALLTLWLMTTFLAGCSKPAEDLFDEAVVASKRGDVKKAVRKLETAVRKNPEFADAHLQLARLYESQQRLDDAIEEYEKTVALRPGQAAALMRLSAIYFDKEQFQKALDQLAPMLNEEAVLYSMATKAQAAQMRALIQRSKRAKETIEQLKETPENAEALSDAYHNYGKILIDRNRPEQASEFQSKAMSLREPVIAKYQQRVMDSPSDASASARLGELLYMNAEAYLMQGNVDAGIDSLKRAVSVDDKKANYLFALAQLCDTQGATDRKDIIAWVEKAVRLDPDNSVYRFALAGFYCGEKRLKEGKAELEKIVSTEEDPSMIARAKKHLALVEKELAEPRPE